MLDREENKLVEIICEDRKFHILMGMLRNLGIDVYPMADNENIEDYFNLHVKIRERDLNIIKLSFDIETLEMIKILYQDRYIFIIKKNV